MLGAEHTKLTRQANARPGAEAPTGPGEGTPTAIFQLRWLREQICDDSGELSDLKRQLPGRHLRGDKGTAYHISANQPCLLTGPASWTEERFTRTQSPLVHEGCPLGSAWSLPRHPALSCPIWAVAVPAPENSPLIRLLACWGGRTRRTPKARDQHLAHVVRGGGTAQGHKRVRGRAESGASASSPALERPSGSQRIPEMPQPPRPQAPDPGSAAGFLRGEAAQRGGGWGRKAVEGATSPPDPATLRARVHISQPRRGGQRCRRGAGRPDSPPPDRAFRGVSEERSAEPGGSVACGPPGATPQSPVPKARRPRLIPARPAASPGPLRPHARGLGPPPGPGSAQPPPPPPGSGRRSRVAADSAPRTPGPRPPAPGPARRRARPPPARLLPRGAARSLRARRRAVPAVPAVPAAAGARAGARSPSPSAAGRPASAP